jgi:tripartite-type tricarboxylate transporter receptor subunit TctC
MRKYIKCGILIAALMASTGVISQTFPNKPVRIVLAYAAGGPTEFLGRLRALAISGRERSQQLPDVPTLYEQGFTDAVVTGWFGLVAHAQTPRPIIARLNADFDAALGMAEVREKISTAGLIPAGGSAEKFTAHIRSESERWTRVIKTRGIKAE